MSKRFITFFFLFAATICGENVYAQKTIVGTNEMPLEINLLISSYQSQSPENFSKILPYILNIDVYARSLTKEDIFLLGKVEVYKTLLKNYDEPIKQPVDGTSINKLRLALEKTTDNFSKWFIQALIKDSQDLINSPIYKEFLLQKSSNVKIEKIEYRKLEKKGELLQFWISKISPDSQEFLISLQNSLAPKMLEALKNIQTSFYFMAKESSLNPIGPALKNESELKFFTVRDIVPMAAPKPDTSKSVEDILAPIIDLNPAELPMPSQDNWLEDQNTPETLQNLPKPSNDADWLQDF